jgi:hypothetical protein
MAQIYISYRVEDSNIVEKIIRRSLQTYGIYSLIMNPEMTCPWDTTLYKHIDNLMFNAASILLIVAPGWAGIDEFGRFKLSSADIPVGEEVLVALRSEKQVILVLVNGATLPSPDVVPDDLHAIYNLPKAELRQATFNQDLNRLIPPPALSARLLYYLSLTWTKNYIRDDEATTY